jgi:hypothetical protein
VKRLAKKQPHPFSANGRKGWATRELLWDQVAATRQSRVGAGSLRHPTKNDPNKANLPEKLGANLFWRNSGAEFRDYNLDAKCVNSLPFLEVEKGVSC